MRETAGERHRRKIQERNDRKGAVREKENSKDQGVGEYLPGKGNITEEGR